MYFLINLLIANPIVNGLLVFTIAMLILALSYCIAVNLLGMSRNR